MGSGLFIKSGEEDSKRAENISNWPLQLQHIKVIQFRWGGGLEDDFYYFAWENNFYFFVKRNQFDSFF